MPEGTKAAELAALRHKLAWLERGAREAGPVLPFGAPALDEKLPGGGLARGMLHEVCGRGAAAEEGAEAASFLAGILARLEPALPVLWCLACADLHAPGLAAHGLQPERLVLAQAGSEAALLWAMEEGLKCRALAAVVGELAVLPDHAGRRLQLAAEADGVTAFVLRRSRFAATAASEAQPNVAATRWRIASLPGRLEGGRLEGGRLEGGRLEGEPGVGRPLWSVELLRCRGALPARWIVEACDATGHVGVADALGDRPAAAAPRRAAG